MDLHWSPLERLGQVFSVRHAMLAIGSKSVIVAVIDFSGTLASYGIWMGKRSRTPERHHTACERFI
jgi:hypothetical protein